MSVTPALKELAYGGFTNNPCVCHYGIGELDGKPAVVFVQGPQPGTSITNKIEALASLVLAKDLAGRRPEEVRFFEHYPPMLEPVRQWQEVTFEQAWPLDKPADGLLAKLISLVAGDAEPQVWAVDKPNWRGIADDKVPAALLALVR